MIPIVFSADDYGIAPATSAVIRSLLASGRLSATSAMTVFPEWPAEGRALASVNAEADLGLHLVLTDQTPLTSMPRLAPEGRFPGIGALTRRAWSGGIHPAEVEAELHAQIDAFEAGVGRLPDHLDGHHHVQQLPGVREVVVKVAASRLGRRAWVRTTAEPMSAVLRRGVSLPKALGFAWAGSALSQQLRAAGVPQPSGFVGAYGFDNAQTYASRLARFLHGARAGTVLMVHPGADDAVLRSRDSMVDARIEEAAFLHSDALPELLGRLGLRIGRLRDVA